jgi:hypothetical protein
VSQAASIPSQFVLGSAEIMQSSRALQWLSPVLLGLAGPLVLMVVLGPSILDHAQFLFSMILLTILIISAGMFTFSVVMRGPVAAVVFDRPTRSVNIIRQGVFANSITVLPFDAVHKIQIASAYDDDGYRREIAELITTEGTSIVLPAGVIEAQIRAAKVILGRK